MTLKPLLDVIHTPRMAWSDAVRAKFSEALRERYPRVHDLTDRKNDERRFQLRVNGDTAPKAVPYAALLGPDQDLSGGYGGMSVVMFPANEAGAPCLLAMVVGTNGLSPDEAVLGRPGHARKCAAIAAWLNASRPGCAWAKRDPVRIDVELPRALATRLAPWSNAIEKYGKVIYATFEVPGARTAANDGLTLRAVTAMVDLFFDERRIEPKNDHRADADIVRREWMARVFPSTTPDAVHGLLASRRFVVVEGPPGTGKTELATALLRTRYGGRGRVIQFHPGTTYESFVGGLAPHEGGAFGFTFRPAPGHLMEAAAEAQRTPDRPHLLVIDEINRADLSKVLGEAIYLFEPGRDDREVTLAWDFPGYGRTLRLPPNLHVLGTMNSADRSIAILDVAVRRRFAFVPLWPQLDALESAGAGPLLRQRFHELLTLFVEHASDDALPLVPGHAYFLGRDEDAPARLATTVRPLLEEYLAQGYAAGFADDLRAYLDRIAQGA